MATTNTFAATTKFAITIESGALVEVYTVKTDNQHQAEILAFNNFGRLYGHSSDTWENAEVTKVEIL